MAKGKETVEWLKGLTDEELFEKSPAPGFTPKEGPSLDYVVCQSCGELTLKGYLKKKGKTQVCKACE